MAEKANASKQLTAASVRAMQPAEQTKLLADKRSELFDAKRSLAARELVNPRKVTQLRREIAVIMTVNNEASTDKETA